MILIIFHIIDVIDIDGVFNNRVIMLYSVNNSYETNDIYLTNYTLDTGSLLFRVIFLDANKVIKKKDHIEVIPYKLEPFYKVVAVVGAITFFPATCISIIFFICKYLADDREKIEECLNKKIAKVAKNNIQDRSAKSEVTIQKEKVPVPTHEPKPKPKPKTTPQPKPHPKPVVEKPKDPVNSNPEVVAEPKNIPSNTQETTTETIPESKPDLAQETCEVVTPIEISKESSLQTLFNLDPYLKISVLQSSLLFYRLNRSDINEQEFLRENKEVLFNFLSSLPFTQLLSREKLFDTDCLPSKISQVMRNLAEFEEASRSRAKLMHTLIKLAGKKINLTVGQLLLPWEYSPVKILIMEEDKIPKLALKELMLKNLPVDILKLGISVDSQTYEFCKQLEHIIQSVRQDFRKEKLTNSPVSHQEWEALQLSTISNLHIDSVENLLKLPVSALPFLSDEVASKFKPSTIGLDYLKYLILFRKSYVQQLDIQELNILIEKFAVHHALCSIYSYLSPDQIQQLDITKLNLNEEIRLSVFNTIYDVKSEEGLKNFKELSSEKITTYMPYLTEMRYYFNALTIEQFKGIDFEDLLAKEILTQDHIDIIFSKDKLDKASQQRAAERLTHYPQADKITWIHKR